MAPSVTHNKIGFDILAGMLQNFYEAGHLEATELTPDSLT